MNLNLEKWKEFKVGELFRIEPTYGIVTDDLIEGNDIPYIAAKKNENGLKQMCQKEGFEDWISKGNCIVFIQLGAGSAGYANYIEEDFIGMNGKTSCGYIDNVMTPKIGMFLATVLSLERPKYSFGRSWTGDRLAETKIMLPVQYDEHDQLIIDEDKRYSSNGYVPDWKFMENYISTLKCKTLTTKNSNSSCPELNTNDWKEFAFNELFYLKSGFYNKKPEHSVEGKFPFLASTENNNGVTELYNLEDIKSWDKTGKADDTLDKKIYEGNCIAVTVDGSVCNAFYQPTKFTSSHSVTAFYLKSYTLNPALAIFLCSVIMLDKYRWSYGRKPHDIKKFEKSIIKLPIQKNKDGSPIIDPTYKYSKKGYVPDWEFMENYIKSLPYGDRL